MGSLTEKEKELVALGAALGSNCIPCMVYHVAAIKKLGVEDAEIKEAVEVADKVRAVPAEQVLKTAYAHIGETSEASIEREKSGATNCGCSS